MKTEDERRKGFSEGVEKLMKQWGFLLKGGIEPVPETPFFKPVVLAMPDPNWSPPKPITQPAAKDQLVEEPVGHESATNQSIAED